MPHLIWLVPAISGLQRIYNFLASKNPDVAQAAIQAIRDKSQLLEKYPNAGRPAHDLEPEHREFLIPFGGSGYVILYRVDGETVYILAVRHQKEVGY